MKCSCLQGIDKWYIIGGGIFLLALIIGAAVAIPLSLKGGGDDKTDAVDTPIAAPSISPSPTLPNGQVAVDPITFFAVILDGKVDNNNSTNTNITEESLEVDFSAAFDILAPQVLLNATDDEASNNNDTNNNNTTTTTTSQDQNQDQNQTIVVAEENILLNATDDEANNNNNTTATATATATATTSRDQNQDQNQPIVAAEEKLNVRRLRGRRRQERGLTPRNLIATSVKTPVPVDVVEIGE